MTDMKADSENLVMTHWKHHVSERKMKELMVISKEHLTEFEYRKEKVYTRFIKKEGINMKKTDYIGTKNGTGTHAVNLHKKVKEQAETNEKYPKKTVKQKLFEGRLPSDQN